MPFDRRNLYRLERLESFSRVTSGFDIKKAVHKFYAGHLESAEIIKKCNHRSIVFSLITGNGRLILKAVDLKLAKTLEAQCNVANRIPSGLIRPLVSSDGCFVIIEDRHAWMAYWAVEGEIYNGRNLSATLAIQACLDLLSQLRDLGTPDGIPTFQYRPERWTRSMAILTDPCSARESLDGSGYNLSPSTLDMLDQHRGQLRKISDSLPSLLARLSPALVHNDLQHANVIVTREGVVCLDLEDLCMNAPQVAAAHAVFKLFRHAVFCGATSPDVAKNEARLFTKKLEIHPAWAGATTGLFECIALRVISDISEILLAWLDAHDASDLYDLEKRLHNLLEAIDLFGETSP